MNRFERAVRDLINPYSTAFATWWCHSARYLRLPRMMVGNKTAGRPVAHRATATHVRVSVLISPSSSPQAPNPGEWTPGLGSAKPIARDATGGSEPDAVAASSTIGLGGKRLPGNRLRDDELP